MDVSRIPQIMRVKGWTLGATLLDEWFAGRAFRKPSSASANFAPPTTNLVSIQWALTFPRVASALDELLWQNAWYNAKSKPLLVKSLQSVVGTQPANSSWDLCGKSAIELHELHVNYRKVESGYFDPLDGLTAALGNFALYVFPLTFDFEKDSTGSTAFTVTRIGCHIYDSFDFEGFQHLGYWNTDRNSVYTFPRPGDDPVLNSDFRIWRDDHGQGGDFPIYSDTLPIELENHLII